MKRRVRFGVSMQWWQFDCLNESNLKTEVELLRGLGIEEVRIINPTPPTWICKQLCTPEYAIESQMRLTKELRKQKIRSTFLLANSLSSVTELMLTDKYKSYWNNRNNNDYEATVDLIHDAIITNNCEVLSIISKEYQRLSLIYDRCQLINAGELFLFNGRNHHATSRYNSISNINKFISYYNTSNVFYDSANIYLQGNDINDLQWLSFARTHFCELKKPLKYVSEFNITEIDSADERARAFVLALRKVINDWSPEVICFHTLFGGWFVLQERGMTHKLWSESGIRDIQSDSTLSPFNNSNPVITQMNGILYSGFDLKEIIEEARR